MEFSLSTSPKLVATTAIDRREAIRQAALLFAALGVGGGVSAKAANLVGAPQRAVLTRIADVLIPGTDTPGAGTTAIVDFFLLATQDGILGASADLPQRLEAEIQSRSAGKFMTLPAPQQVEVVTTLDRYSYSAQGPTGSAWPMSKGLILIGYYTSETGASRELQYELVPGHFDPDVPVQAGTKAWSSDWTGVTIRKGGPN